MRLELISLDLSEVECHFASSEVSKFYKCVIHHGPRELCTTVIYFKISLVPDPPTMRPPAGLLDMKSLILDQQLKPTLYPEQSAKEGQKRWWVVVPNLTIGPILQVLPIDEPGSSFITYICLVLFRSVSGKLRAQYVTRGAIQL